MPTRVLDVGAPTLRLHISTEHGKTSPYAALSHCWGSTPILTLKLSNIRTMQIYIDAKALPKTFHDAIDITRRLGLRYLWVDSLCIIQDSIEDWQRESSNMGAIYQNSVCNIAATAAPDGRSGCFFRRNPWLAEQCHAFVDGASGSTDSPERSTKSHIIVPHYQFVAGVLRAPLNNRAWVTQERIMSPRTIHFSKNQIFWECHELVSDLYC